MSTRKFAIALMAILMGSQMMFAQERKGHRAEGKRPNKEQMQQKQCDRLVKGLELDSETAARFTALYKEYQGEMQALRRPATSDKRKAKAELTDAEVENALKAGFAHNRQKVDLREKYYDRFRTILSPRQIQKMYSLEKGHANRSRSGVSPKQGGHKADGGGKGKGPRAHSKQKAA